MMEDADRRAFLDGHVEVIREFGGHVERVYETVLVSSRLASV